VDMVERSSNNLSSHWAWYWNLRSLVSKVYHSWTLFESMHCNHHCWMVVVAAVMPCYY